MTQEKLEKIGAVLAVEENAKALAEINTTEATIAFFAAHGVEMSADEVAQLAVSLASLNSDAGDELDETALEGVAGGAIPVAVVWLLKNIIGPIAVSYAVKYGIKWVEKKFGKDFNGDGKIG